MRSARRIFALVVMFIMLFSVSASAFTLPKGFEFSDSKPKKGSEAVILTENANFYSTEGKLGTLKRGDTVTVKGMKDATYAKVVAGGVKGYVNAKCLMSMVGVSAYVAKDCWAYEYDGDQKTRTVWGTKVYMVGRYKDKNGTNWILCTNKDGDGLAYIKKSNLYR
jgi:hypothetical protein